MAEMKNLKIEVVRYNPEVDTVPLVLPYGDLWLLRHDG